MGGAARQLTIACSILLSMATTLAPEALEESREAGSQQRAPEHPPSLGVHAPQDPHPHCNAPGLPLHWGSTHRGTPPGCSTSHSTGDPRTGALRAAPQPDPPCSRGTEGPPPPGATRQPARKTAGEDRGRYRGCPYLLSSFTETTSPPSREEKNEMEKLWSW